MKKLLLILIILNSCGSRKVETAKVELKQETKTEQTTKQEAVTVAKLEDKTETKETEQKENKEAETRTRTVFVKEYYENGNIKAIREISENSQKLKLENSYFKKELKNEIRKSDSLSIKLAEAKEEVTELEFKEKTKVTESSRPMWQMWLAILIVFIVLIYVIYQEFLKKIL